MGASGAARGSAECDDLAATDATADSDFDLREVHVDAHEPEAVVDDDAAAFKVERTGKYDATGVDCGYRRVQLRVVVEGDVRWLPFR